MKVLYLDTIMSSIEEKEIEDNLDTYYKLLNCRCIDIATRKIGNNWYDIICDDEGLLKQEIIPSAIYESNKEIALVGNLIIAKNDGYGNIIGLEEEEIEEIKKHIVEIYGFKLLEVSF